MRKNPKVFCSHRSKDKPRVEEIAQKLRAAGIDAWLDKWEILPGADFVAAINKGLEECDTGLIFFSQEVEAGKWVQAEISALTVQNIEDGKPLIPVFLDPDIPIPALLRPLSRLGADLIDEFVAAIYHRSGKPRLAPPRPEQRRRTLLIRLAAKTRATALHKPPQEISVEAWLDTAPIAPSQPVRLGADFEFSYADFLHTHPPVARDTSLQVAIAARDRDLHNLGRAIGRVLFAGSIDAQLSDLLDTTAAANEELHIVIETSSQTLLSIPLESARLANGRAPALEPGVVMYRRLAGVTAKQPPPRPGPLKILVAVGAPDEDKTPNTVLDMEGELQTILDAIEQARRYGNAHARILEVGSIDQIRHALEEQTCHVLHLSGHGNAGILELEDEDGAPVPAKAADIARAIRESGRLAPVVFLASCHSGSGSTETAGLAYGLLREGIPLVVAMQAAVSDRYATHLAGLFYSHLARGERPRASVALSQARREVETERRKVIEQGETTPDLLPEYATPAFYSQARKSQFSIARSPKTVGRANPHDGNRCGPAARHRRSGRPPPGTTPRNARAHE